MSALGGASSPGASRLDEATLRRELSRVRAHEPSRTAAWVAAMRGLAAFLPRVASRALSHDYLLGIQIRTRVLDDVMLGFLAQGGRQVLLLGAGFDCRA